MSEAVDFLNVNELTKFFSVGTESVSVGCFNLLFKSGVEKKVFFFVEAAYFVDSSHGSDELILFLVLLLLVCLSLRSFTGDFI